MTPVVAAIPSMIVLALALRIAVRISYGARGPSAHDPLYVFLMTGSWVVFGGAIAPMLALSLFTPFGIVLAMFLFGALVEAVLARRKAQRHTSAALLSMMADSGLGLELAQPLTLLHGPGMVGDASRRLVQFLEGGSSLPAAVAQNPRALPREAVAYMAMGELTRDYPGALRKLAARGDSPLAAVRQAFVDRAMYLAAVFATLSLGLPYVFIEIAPEFENIFMEFGMNLPPLTQVVLGAGGSFGVSTVAIVIGTPLLLLLPAAFVLTVLFLCDASVLRPVGDWFTWRRYTAEVHRLIAFAIAHGAEVSSALAKLSETVPWASVRSRVADASGDTARGVDWIDACRKAGIFTKSEAALVHSSVAAGNAPWVLETLADRRQRVQAFRGAAWLNVAYPLLLLWLGVLVGIFVIAMFVPLVSLIEALA